MTLPRAELSAVRKVVLVVDDEILIRMVVSEYLREEGYHVIEAGSADEALDYLRTANPVDLVFSDVKMPGSMEGVELAQRLKGLYPDLPVILASGHLLPGDAGDTPLFSKPYVLADVAAKVSALIGGTDERP
jgi:CheY-like chemotaxis protein